MRFTLLAEASSPWFAEIAGELETPPPLTPPDCTPTPTPEPPSQAAQRCTECCRQSLLQAELCAPWHQDGSVDLEDTDIQLSKRKRKRSAPVDARFQD